MACFHDILKVLMHWWIRRSVLTSVVTPDLLSLLFLNAKLDSKDPVLCSTCDSTVHMLNFFSNRLGGVFTLSNGFHLDSRWNGWIL